MSTDPHALPAQDRDPNALVGTVIDGRYELTELVGLGGMGAVYKAQHVTIRRTVALKILGPELAAMKELARRFEREAYAIGRIDHPNCISVLDFGKLADGSLYLTMEYLDGISLATLLEREGRIPPRRALHIIRHVLRGLGHAHERSIVHRDVKPENVILVEQDGIPEFAKLLDFGIARLLDETGSADPDAKLTQAGVAFGTPVYISPEQAIGEPAGPAADLYAATVVLYEMLAGQPPFQATDRMELLAMHVGRPPPPLSVVLPEYKLPAVLYGLVNRGLAKRPRDRFEHADDLIAAIDAALLEPLPGDDQLVSFRAPPPAMSAELADLIEATTPPPAAYPRIGEVAPLRRPTPAAAPHLQTSDRARHLAGRARRWLRRHRALALGVAIVALILVVALIGFGRGHAALVAGLKSPQASGAERSLGQGDPTQAIRLLGAGHGVSGDAEAQLQLGHAHASRSEYRAALAAYDQALTLDPGLIHDDRMVANLRLMFDDDGPILVEAARLLATHAGDQAAVVRIVALASHPDASIRHAAFAIAEELGLGDRIDRLASFALDLDQGATCARRRAAVGMLRALGDPRAVPALEQARNRPSKPHRHGRPKNLNACLVRAAEDAIKVLGASAKPAAP